MKKQINIILISIIYLSIQLLLLNSWLNNQLSYNLTAVIMMLISITYGIYLRNKI